MNLVFSEPAELICYFSVLVVEYAVCTRGKIFLYDDKWTELEPKIVKDGFEHMKTITYDPVNDVFYFHDRKHPTTSIFLLKVRDDTTFLTTPLVARTENEVIEDLVYDFHDKALYWSDSGNKKIEKLSIDSSKNLKTTRETFLNVSGAVSGMEIDSCQRNLYFTIVTVDSPSINVISLDKKGAKPVSFGAQNHAKPVAVAMDHQNRRLYIADDRGYNSYSIDSLKPDGSDFRTEIEKTHKTPRSIAVDSHFVYYIEGNNNELRRFAKNAEKKTSELFKEYISDPSDIIVRSNSITDLDPSKCKLPATSISNVKKEMEQKAHEKELPSKMCLHGGSLDKTTSSCMCKENFDGDFCEINLCYNFCLNGGECSMSKNEKSLKIEPTCSCKRGFSGLHCELDVCSNFCLNNGRCSVGANKKATCTCTDTFSGSRCELLSSETLPVLIDANKKVEAPSTTVPTIKVPESSEQHEINIIEELPENLIHNADERVHPDVFQCPQQPINPTYIILGVCITISLFIFLAILFVIKKIHKPMRPRIRKKYVVHKNSEQLTYRPTTEQCEVIIEDCCNMNICETVSISYKIR